MSKKMISTPSWLRPVIILIAVLCVAGGLIRVYMTQIPDRDVLLFFLAAVVVLLADTVTKFKLGDVEFERVRDLEERVDELAEVSRPQDTPRAQSGPLVDSSEEPASPSPTSLETRAQAIMNEIYRPPLEWNDDPVARRSGHDTAQGHRLVAVVTPSRNYAGLFRVTCSCIVGPDIRGQSNNARVAFFLHHTFTPRVRIVPIENRAASITVVSQGTFTVGALLFDGTFLSLDLSRSDLGQLSDPQQQQFLNG